MNGTSAEQSSAANQALISVSVCSSRIPLTAREQMNLPGFDFHALKGFVPTRYTVHVNGPWCITFEFDSGDAFRVDFEQYH
jgi:plasmid maintenance system killer protein